VSLRRRLAAGEATVGTWITLGHPSIADVLARAGFDWLVVDMEHSVIGLREAQDLLRAADVAGVPGIVRLPSNDPVVAKRVMDAGAAGVMVPMVNSAADAEAAVAAVRYPPRGTRGVGLARAQGYGAPGAFAAYRDRLDDEAVVVVMIEHVDAVAAIDSILAVDGVDAFIVGPYDLSGSLGVPGELEDPRVLAALETVHAAGRRHGVPGGLHVVEPEPARLRAALDAGHRFVGYGLDVRFLDAGARSGLGSVGR
jgi:2-dehydro-3-deoxyglucarate aldolase